MAYDYQTERPAIFTEDGQKRFLNIRGRVQRLIKTAGAVRMQEAISGETGDSWSMLACVDRLVELGEIRELTNTATPGQYRVFVSTYRD